MATVMTLKFEAEMGERGEWYGLLRNTTKKPQTVTIEAAPTLPMGLAVEAAVTTVPAKGVKVIGFIYSGGLRLSALDLGAERPKIFRPLSEPFPTNAGFRLSWGTAGEMVVDDGLPQREFD